MWSSDLGWVPKSILHEAREKEVKKLQQFETYEEVPLAESEGQEIVSSRFVRKMGRKWRTEISPGFERLRVESGGPGCTLCYYTFGCGDENCACVGLAQDVEMAVADISGAFLHAVLDKHFFVTPPTEYCKPSVVWKIKRYLYRDKRAPRGWQDHFENTMLELGFERLESDKSLAMASSSPTKGHMRRLKRVLRYIQGTRDMLLELVRPREQLTELVGWCDGSWADLDGKRRSTTGRLLMLGGACVAGWSRTQKPTALSSGESEFYSAEVCACGLAIFEESWDTP